VSLAARFGKLRDERQVIVGGSVERPSGGRFRADVQRAAVHEDRSCCRVHRRDRAGDVAEHDLLRLEGASADLPARGAVTHFGQFEPRDRADILVPAEDLLELLETDLLAVDREFGAFGDHHPHPVHLDRAVARVDPLELAGERAQGRGLRLHDEVAADDPAGRSVVDAAQHIVDPDRQVRRAALLELLGQSVDRIAHSVDRYVGSFEHRHHDTADRDRLLDLVDGRERALHIRERRDAGEDRGARTELPRAVFVDDVAFAKRQ